MFSKYDVYATVQSIYCYPDTDVLINKLGIGDNEAPKDNIAFCGVLAQCIETEDE